MSRLFSNPSFLLAATFTVLGQLPAAITIDTVLVSDSGNANDSTGYGAVSYDYHIGTYEVTNAQYTIFLNAVASTDTHGLYNINLGSLGIERNGSDGSYTYSTVPGLENNPVGYIHFWDAARFTNWLTTGDTETGVYNLGGETNPTNSSITRDATAWANGGVAIASENEWYKAAYYQPAATGGDSDDYWLNPTASNSITTTDANYDNPSGNVTPVGTYADRPSYYGTFDQGGNVLEWNNTPVGSDFRVMRGGSYYDGIGSKSLESTYRRYHGPGFTSNSLGFRVTSLAPIVAPLFPFRKK